MYPGSWNASPAGLKCAELKTTGAAPTNSNQAQPEALEGEVEGEVEGKEETINGSTSRPGEFSCAAGGVNHK